MTSYANQKTKLTTFAGSAILVFSSTAFSAGRIEASLSPSVSISPHSSATVVLHVRNVGDEPVLIYRWNTPFVETGRLPGPVFDVSDQSGRPVRYLGRRVHVGPARLAHYVSLAAGDSLEKEVDLGKEYEFDKAGWYTVNFSLYLNIEPDKTSSPIEDLEGYVPNVQEIVATNPVTLLVRHPIDHTSMVGTEAQAITCDLALTNRSKAVRSAANFEYFITDTGNERFKPVKEAVVPDE